MKLTIPVLMAGVAMGISMQAIANPACSRYQPGHYVRVDDDNARKLDGLAALRNVLSKDVRNLKGVFYTINWGLIEKSQGVYDFSRIDAALAQAKAKGKYLHIKFWDRTVWTGCASNFAPSYVARAGTPKGTGFGSMDSAKWCAAKIWEKATMDHEIRVLRALLNRYKNDPYFLGISPSEETNIAAVGQETTAQHLALYEQLRRRNAALAEAAPDLLISQNFNWPSAGKLSNFDPLVKGLLDMNGGGGLGWPDTLPTKATSWSWYNLGRNNRDRLFIFPEFQGTYFSNDGRIATWEGIYRFATQDIGAHAVVWSSSHYYNNKWDGIRYFTDVVIPLMNKYPKVTTKGCPWM